MFFPDPFSMIILYWTVALAVIITLLVGSFVIIAFLHRKKGELRAGGMEHREVLCMDRDGRGGAELWSTEVHRWRNGDFSWDSQCSLNNICLSFGE